VLGGGVLDFAPLTVHGELLSYRLFDPEFIEALIDLGRCGL
jgi:hypothetical protein